MNTGVTSWGRILPPQPLVREPAFADEVPALLENGAPSLAFGMGRSYGDVCLNREGSLIRMQRLDRVLHADWDQGYIRAEAGMSLDALLSLCVPKGWFVPVTPGTKFVTLGGAVANDVHGKNHEAAGTFGLHVRRLGLLRSTGETLELGPDNDPELFSATVGGLGLTGLILWVGLKLAPINSAYFVTETTRMENLDDFFRLSREAEDWPYTVAWVDCLAEDSRLGSGLFTRGRHAEQGELKPHRTRRRARVLFDAPTGLLSAPLLRAFNFAYARRPRIEGRRQLHYDTFLYPLDGILDWNRCYGRPGFFQHQSVVAPNEAPEVLERLLQLTTRSGQGSFLVVLKMLGGKRSPGLLSFPMEGATFAIDLPNRGKRTLDLLRQMEEIVLAAGGRLYPAKDATMSPEAFRAGFPRWRELEDKRDPALMSDFWRRVTGDAA